MTQFVANKLKEKLDSISMWENRFVHEDLPTDFKSFIFESLEVIRTIMPDNDDINMIASELFVDMNFQEDIKEDLFNQFANIEEKLDENVRGFCNLLNNMLMDSSISIDFDNVLNSPLLRTHPCTKPFREFLHGFVDEKGHVYEESTYKTTLFLSLIFKLIHTMSGQKNVNWQNKIMARLQVWGVKTEVIFSFKAFT